MTVAWTTELHDQLDWYWQHHLRPRLDGLTDDEYFWQPVPNCWTVRPRTEKPDGPGAGDFTVDFAYPEPVPPPVTTIAWRLSHIIVGVLGMRAASHFGGPAMSYETFPYAGTAAEALDQLDSAYGNWISGVEKLDAEALARPVGEAEGPYAASPMATLVLHISRETIHHGAEVLLLRDLYRNR
ncbi:DinB family protein [Amycolatopsis carbonis]|uniref:DinB family protein n=1 Tax=Amycolatopsis carbonis TaxID=715471 RepID=A0A9Y2III7_9PSEU|nr:DinB family protein [Amycolatopsis sp. 2-15]WIX79906.1 DinB family protein [Amycolatopsis sp. 2-15]